MTSPTERHADVRALADLIDGTASPARHAHLTRHVEGCVRCERRLGRLRRIVNAIAAGALEVPPNAALADASRLLRETGHIDADGWEIATLLIDVAPHEAAGVRSLSAPARHLLWSAGPLEIDVHVSARDGVFDLTGFVLPPDDDAIEGGDRLEFVCRGKAVASSYVGPDGRFSARGLRKGVYVARGRVAGVRLLIPELVIG